MTGLLRASSGKRIILTGNANFQDIIFLLQIFVLNLPMKIRLLRRDGLIAITNYSTTFYRQESGNSLNLLEERKAAEHDPPQHFRLPQYAE